MPWVPWGLPGAGAHGGGAGGQDRRGSRESDEQGVSLSQGGGRGRDGLPFGPAEIPHATGWQAWREPVGADLLGCGHRCNG